jgi:outer membrane receptor protein involved in Fe transport
MKGFKSAALLLAGASAFAIPGVAQAQSSSEDVVVTGSRVIRNGNASPTPLTVVSTEEMLRVSPTTISEALNTLPTFSGSRGQLSNPNGGTASQSGGGNSAGSFLNLRNMGAVRTLILFDGHRVPPSNVTGVVDTDAIPQQLLQRVDVVTGGVSAVYGSDAVSGVVNFVTDRRFNGAKARVQYGVTEMGDDVSYNAGLAAGTDLFDGRGHMEGSFEYRNGNGVGRRSSRDPEHKVYSVQGAGTAANPYYLTPNARVNNQTFGGLITSGVLNGQTFNTNGVLTPMVHGAVSGTNGIEIGGDGIWYDNSLKTPARSTQVFGRFDYDFTDKIHGYIEAAGNNKINEINLNWANINNLVLSAQNAYLPQVYRNQLAAANQTTFTFRKAMQDVERGKVVADGTQVFFNSGLEGEFGDGYRWELGYVHSDATLNQTATNINNGRQYAALDAVVNPANGQIVCSVTLTNPTLYPGCIPINPFGPTTDSQDAVDYYVGRTLFTADTAINDISGSVSGTPFSTWAGPVAVALSGEWRKVVYSGTSESLPTDRLACTGLRFNCTATSTTWNSTIANRSEVSQTVKEGAVEADVPLIADAPLIQSFNVNGAVRYTSYSTSGNYTTWKVGVDWHVIDSLRLRGTRSRDIRAPTLDDLFSPTSSNVGNFPDNLTNTTPTNVTTVSGGNPDLTAEQGDTWTAGLVFRPSALPGFSVSVDYYDIKVTNAILQLLAMNATFQKACYDSAGSSPYCSLQVRPLGFTNTSAANTPTTVYNRQINIAEQDTNGADMETNYSTSLFGRPASIRLLTTWQPHIKYIQPTVPTLDQAGAAFGTNGVTAASVWRNTVFVRFSPIENFTVDVQTRWRTELRLSGDPTHVISSGPVPANSFTNLGLAYRMKGALGDAEAFLNVTNLFDRAPSPAGFYGGQTIPGQQTSFPIYDDPLGRAYAIGLRTRF